MNEINYVVVDPDNEIYVVTDPADTAACLAAALEAIRTHSHFRVVGRQYIAAAETADQPGLPATLGEFEVWVSELAIAPIWSADESVDDMFDFNEGRETYSRILGWTRDGRGVCLTLREPLVLELWPKAVDDLAEDESGIRT